MKNLKIFKITTLLVVLFMTHSTLGQNCSEYLNWTEYPSSHVFFNADQVYYEGKVYSPCYFSTTAPLSDPFNRDENGCGTTQWGFVTNCNTLSNNVYVSDLNGVDIKSIQRTKQIIISGRFAERTNVTIYDLNGKVTLTASINAFNPTTRINLKNLIEGIYLIRLNSNSQTVSKQILIK